MGFLGGGLALEFARDGAVVHMGDDGFLVLLLLESSRACELAVERCSCVHWG